MSWKTTMNVSRKAAIKAIKENIDKADSVDIFVMLDVMLGDKTGYNFDYFVDEPLEDSSLESLIENMWDKE